MAKLTVRSWRDEAGHPVHPVARVLVTLPDDPDPMWADGPTRMRVTLRSDGAILRAVQLSRGWTAHTVVTKSPTGFPCCGAQPEMADRLVRFATSLWRGATAVPEYVDPAVGLR